MELTKSLNKEVVVFLELNLFKKFFKKIAINFSNHNVDFFIEGFT